MGTHFYLLLFFQIIWPNVIAAPLVSDKVTMAQKIDLLASKQNKVVHNIWKQEPASVCDIEKPSDKMLTNKILKFNFIPYLCVIFYDTSLRYLKLNTSQPDNAQGIIEKFSPDTFCQKMKDNKWFTTIEENKFWVSNFSNDMNNKNVCQRYCVSEIVNPICAYTLWLDLAIKQTKHGSLPPSSNAEEPHQFQPILSTPKKEQADASFEDQVNNKVSNPHLSDEGSMRLNVNAGNKRQPPSAVTTRQYGGRPLSLGNQVPATSSQNQYIPNAQLYPDQSYVRDPPRDFLPGENNSKKPDLAKTEKAPTTSNDLSFSGVGRTLTLENANGREYPAHSNNALDIHLSHDPKQDFKSDKQVLTPSEHNLGPNLILTNSSQQDIRNPQKNIQVVKSVPGSDQLDLPNPSGTTSSVNTHQAPVSGLEGHTGPNIQSSPPVSREEYNTEGQEPVSGDQKASATLVGGNDPDKAEQVDATSVASQGDSPKPSVPEIPKIPVVSEDKTDQARVITTVPENVTKEVSGSPLGGSTEPKPDVDQIGRSEPEAANQAMEGEGRAISGEPDDHEEQNALDDSQVENGEALGDHGGDQTQDRDEAAFDMDQDLPTETHRYNEGDNDESSRPDGSTKLSNNNNNKEYLSDEDEGPWPAGKIPINDADGGYAHDRFVDAEDSHFFAYFMTMIVLCILGYLIFHNKQKILALALEGRARKGTRRRPSTSGYRKLDSNLEEAVTSSCTGSSVTHVIY